MTEIQLTIEVPADTTHDEMIAAWVQAATEAGLTARLVRPGRVPMIVVDGYEYDLVRYTGRRRTEPHTIAVRLRSLAPAADEYDESGWPV